MLLDTNRRRRPASSGRKPSSHTVAISAQTWHQNESAHSIKDTGISVAVYHRWQQGYFICTTMPTWQGCEVFLLIHQPTVPHALTPPPCSSPSPKALLVPMQPMPSPGTHTSLSSICRIVHLISTHSFHLPSVPRNLTMRSTVDKVKKQARTGHAKRGMLAS